MPEWCLEIIEDWFFVNVSRIIIHTYLLVHATEKASLKTTKQDTLNKNSVAFSSQENYTDRMTSAYQRSQCQLFRVDWCRVSAQRITMAVNLGFLDRRSYFFMQVAPQLFSLN
jgi:hypothetical protein